MSTSGSTNYSIDRDTMIKESLQLVGAIGEGIPPNANQLTDATRTLNIMLKAWQAYGMQLWSINKQPVDLAASTNSYTFGPAGSDIVERPLKITEVFIRDTAGTDSYLSPLSRQEYMYLANKSSTGTPSQYYYDPQIGSGTLYVYPAPNTSAATSTMYVVYQSPIEDMDSATDEFDFPQEWYEAVKYGLAHRLAPVYGMDYMSRTMLKKDFEDILELAKSWDTEQESVFFGVERG